MTLATAIGTKLVIARHFIDRAASSALELSFYVFKVFTLPTGALLT